MPFSPPQPTHLKLWLRPDALSAGSLATWADDSGNANDATMAHATVVANVLNGRAAVRASGGNLTGTLATSIAGVGDCSIFVVQKSSGVVTILGSLGNGTQVGMGITVDDSAFFYQEGLLVSDAFAAPRSAYAVVEWLRAANTVSFYEGGTARGTGTIAGNIQVDGISPGANASATIDLLEVLLWDVALGTTDRQAVESYLDGKYFGTGGGGGGATSYTLSGPTSGPVGVASGNFTVIPDAAYTGTITPHTSGTGTLSPTSLTFAGESTGKTFTYTPTTTSGSPHAITATSSPALTDPPGVNYTVNPGPARKVVFAGNSLTRGAGSTGGNTYPARALAILGADWTGVNSGVDGQSAADIIADYADQVGQHYDGTKSVNVLVLWELTNDLYFGATAATAWSRYRTIAAAARAQGFRVVLATALPRDQPGLIAGFEAARAAANALVLAGWRPVCDALMPLHQDTRVGDAGDEADATYYDADSVHMNNTGYGVVAAHAVTAILEAASSAQLAAVSSPVGCGFIRGA